MIKKSEKLVCAYIALAGEKYANSFTLKNLLFTAQELLDKANTLFNDSDRIIGPLDLQNSTRDIGSSSNQKLFVKGSAASLNDYYRLGTPDEVSPYDIHALVEKLMPVAHRCLPWQYSSSGSSTTDAVVRFLQEYFDFIRRNPTPEQNSNYALSSREAVWIAAAALTYNEYLRTGSTTAETYLFPQSSISRLASVFNPQHAAATYSQVTGQSVTQGKNQQHYAYLIPNEDKRRIASNSDDTIVRPEQLTEDFTVSTIDGLCTVLDLANFISLQYTQFIEAGAWGAGFEKVAHRSLDRAASTDVEEPTFINNAITDVGLNTILYGPPGTGKTYHTVIYAVAIVENKKLAVVEAEAKENYGAVLSRYNEYKAQGRIEFTTFHQSYGYEEFIEGIKPTVSSEDEAGDVQYSVQPGVFKRFCERAERPTAVKTEGYGIRENPTVWKVSLWSTGENDVRTECLKNGHIRIGWDQYGKDITDETDFSADGGRVVLNAFINRMQIGDIVFSCYSASTIDAIGVVTGEYEWHEEYEYFRRLRKVKWIVKNIRENILDINGGTSMTLASVYRLSSVTVPDVYQIIDKFQPVKSSIVSNGQENYVFIIDEINRGNISKIFGELITLIESSKRVGKPEGMKAMLPYSQKPFGVPRNVYIIGTMNTADRSIAAIDTALRRRFFFKEMLPNAKVLANISIEDLSISELLTRMNKRIAVLYDREHMIGHAYFMPLKDNPTIETMAEIFSNNIIPLLQEYFYEDYEKIRLVLGDNRKTEETVQFIIRKSHNYAELFGDADIGLDDGNSFEINEKAFGNIEAYRSI